MDDVTITAEHSMAAASAIVTYAGISKGKELRALQNRLPWVLRRERGGWKVVHEHTSAPVSLTDSKAILRRETGCWPC